MPNGPNRHILDRDFAVANAAVLTDISRPLLQEIVNYCTHLLMRCHHSAQGETDEHVAVLSLFRSSIDLVDGVEVLTSAATPGPTVALVRSLFEHLLAIEYLVEDSDKYTDRSFAWYVFRLAGRIRYLEMLDPGTSKGALVKTELGADEVASQLDLASEVDNVRQEIQSLNGVSEKPHLAPYYQEMLEGRVSKKGRKRAYSAWYNMRGGPVSIYGLANHLGRGGMYRMLYPLWSNEIHATGALVYRVVNNEVALRPLRYPVGLKDALSFTIPFAIWIVQKLMEEFRDGEDWRPWYIREVSPRYMAILGEA